MTHHLLAKGELLAAVRELVDPIVTAARQQHGGRLPSMKTTEWLDANPFVKLATLLVLGESYVVCDPHQTVREQLKGASLDVHGGDTELWRALALRQPRAEILARRAAPATPVVCTAPDCTFVWSVSHPLPDLSTVRCHRHRGEGSAAA
jgi:hypothetical protein